MLCLELQGDHERALEHYRKALLVVTGGGGPFGLWGSGASPGLVPSPWGFFWVTTWLAP